MVDTKGTRPIFVGRVPFVSTIAIHDFSKAAQIEED